MACFWDTTHVKITCGPYNKSFNLRENESFFIDRTIRLSTMMLSGIIVVEVQTQLRQTLVCLDTCPQR